MNNLILKDKDDANVTFQAASAGTLNSPAVWIHSGSLPVLAEKVTVQVKPNGSRTADKVRITVSLPGVNALCEDSCEVHNIPVGIDLTLPTVMASDRRKDAVAYVSSLFANQTVIDAIVNGFVPA